ncbi:hypothetical protein ACFYO1_01885 [Nocardia sp. NPDC006044]|uniref:hypothetical protein n=1 Tax=Nocardia sp. NPDC006044 TaxID=3364306 RepID=UPI0036C1E330
MIITNKESLGGMARQWAAAAANMLNEAVEDPRAAGEGQAATMDRVRVFQAQAQIYATLEVAERIRDVQASMPD